MELILQYIYLRQINLTRDNALDVMRMANVLGVSGLVSLCHEFVVEYLGPDNCVTVLQFAEYVLYLQNITCRVRSYDTADSHVNT